MQVENGKLVVSLNDLIIYNQQVIVRDKDYPYSAVMCTFKGKICSYKQAESIVLPISLDNVSHIEIVQTFGGGGCTTIYAKDKLNLMLPIKASYLTDDNLEEEGVVDALRQLTCNLNIANIKYDFDLKAGSFCIEVIVKQ